VLGDLSTAMYTMYVMKPSLCFCGVFEAMVSLDVAVMVTYSVYRRENASGGADMITCIQQMLNESAPLIPLQLLQTYPCTSSVLLVDSGSSKTVRTVFRRPSSSTPMNWYWGCVMSTSQMRRSLYCTEEGSSLSTVWHSY
jgi:hypothetical protein